MKIQRLIYFSLVLVVTATNSLARDYADFNFIGFSRDGKYLAFEESGTGDYFGGIYATTYYIETAKNSFAAKPSALTWTRELPANSKKLFLSKYKQNVAANLQKFKIVRSNVGQLVVAHLLNDLSLVKPVERKHFFFNRDGVQTDALVPDYEGGFVRCNVKNSANNLKLKTIEYEGRQIRCGNDGIEKIIFNPFIDSYRQNTDEFYELTLETILVAGNVCGEAYKIELSLNDHTQHSVKKKQILQKDADVLPKTRNCPFSYRVERVYVYKGKIAVFLNVFSLAVRGADMRYISITGKFIEN